MIQTFQEFHSINESNRLSGATKSLALSNNYKKLTMSSDIGDEHTLSIGDYTFSVGIDDDDDEKLFIFNDKKDIALKGNTVMIGKEEIISKNLDKDGAKFLLKMGFEDLTK